MLFKLDENTPLILKKIIEGKGAHKVDSVFSEKLSGIDDKKLFEHCTNKGKILITWDYDFLSPIYSDEKNKGIIILRPATQGKKSLEALFKKFISKFPFQKIAGKKIIVYPSEIKIR